MKFFSMIFTVVLARDYDSKLIFTNKTSENQKMGLYYCIKYSVGWAQITDIIVLNGYPNSDVKNVLHDIRYHIHIYHIHTIL